MKTVGDDILIAGAGIGGLAAALALARIGRRVRLMEQRTLRDEEGAGIQIGPNGVHVLRTLGLAEALTSHAVEPAAIVVVDGRSGRAVTRLPLASRMRERFGAPYWTLRRSDLHTQLRTKAEECAGVELETGCRVEAAMTTVDGDARVQLADGTHRTGAALIGADGLWSTVASTLLGAPVPQPGRRSAARSVLPPQAMPPGVADVVDPDCVGLWLGPGAHLVHYPVGVPHTAERLVNVVAIATEPERAATQSWAEPVARDVVTQGFAGWSPRALGVLAAPQSWRRWSLQATGGGQIWNRGPVALLGDAAHPVLPFLAQGAVLALEDAVVLAAAVAAYPHDLPRAFARYVQDRRARAAKVAAASRRNGQIYHLTGPAGLARNAVMSWLPGERLLATYDWLYGWRCPDLPGKL